MKGSRARSAPTTGFAASFTSSFASAFVPGRSRRYHAAPAPPATKTSSPTTSSSFPFPLFDGASASAAALSSAIASSHARSGAREGQQPICHEVGEAPRAARLHDLDPVVLRGGDLLLGGHQLLVQLLARAEADEADRDVLVGLEAREPDHLPGEVEDAHGLPHVEDEDLAAPAEGGGLQD